MTDKFIMVSNKEEADKAVEYFKGLGYHIGTFAPDFGCATCSVVAEEQGRDIWHSCLGADYFIEERKGFFEQHFLPKVIKKVRCINNDNDGMRYFKIGGIYDVIELYTDTDGYPYYSFDFKNGVCWDVSRFEDVTEEATPALPNIYIPINNKEEFEQAKILVEEMGYSTHEIRPISYFDGVENITCEDNNWYSGGTEEDEDYFSRNNIQKYLLKSETIIKYTLEKAAEKWYEVKTPSATGIIKLPRKDIQAYIKELQDLIGE